MHTLDHSVCYWVIGSGIVPWFMPRSLFILDQNLFVNCEPLSQVITSGGGIASGHLLNLSMAGDDLLVEPGYVL